MQNVAIRSGMFYFLEAVPGIVLIFKLLLSRYILIKGVLRKWIFLLWIFFWIYIEYFSLCQIRWSVHTPCPFSEVCLQPIRSPAKQPRSQALFDSENKHFNEAEQAVTEWVRNPLPSQSQHSPSAVPGWKASQGSWNLAIPFIQLQILGLDQQGYTNPEQQVPPTSPADQ